jgi:hypothetical protein
MRPKQTYHANELMIERVQKRVCPKFDIQPNGCWLWRGYINPKTGYGEICYTKTLHALAHRYIYELVLGSIPEGLQLDHRCHNLQKRTCVNVRECMHRRCVNPNHLEPVTPKINSATGNVGRWHLEKTTCPYGHPYDLVLVNSVDKARTFRGCSKCLAANKERKRQRARAGALKS